MAQFEAFEVLKRWLGASKARNILRDFLSLSVNAKYGLQGKVEYKRNCILSFEGKKAGLRKIPQLEEHEKKTARKLINSRGLKSSHSENVLLWRL